MVEQAILDNLSALLDLGFIYRQGRGKTDNIAVRRLRQQAVLLHQTINTQ